MVSEMANLFHEYADTSNLESIALTSTMIMPHLLLQKPDEKLNAHKKSQCLSHRLSAWKNGDIGSLLTEGRAIQQRLCFKRAPRPSSESDLSRQFAQCINNGSS